MTIDPWSAGFGTAYGPLNASGNSVTVLASGLPAPLNSLSLSYTLVGGNAVIPLTSGAVGVTVPPGFTAWSGLLPSAVPLQVGTLSFGAMELTTLAVSVPLNVTGTRPIGYQLWYCKIGATAWSKGPLVPVIVPGTGAFKDTAGNTYTVVPTGQIAINGVVDLRPSAVLCALLMPNQRIWLENLSGGWYWSPTPVAAGNWTGPVSICPMITPGVMIGGLSANTAYYVTACAVGTAGTGPAATVISGKTSK